MPNMQRPRDRRRWRRRQTSPTNAALSTTSAGPYTARGIEYLVAELGRRAQARNVHPQRFRHDTARRLIETVDLPTVAAWLGPERLLDTERAAAALESR